MYFALTKIQIIFIGSCMVLTGILFSACLLPEETQSKSEKEQPAKSVSDPKISKEQSDNVDKIKTPNTSIALLTPWFTIQDDALFGIDFISATEEFVIAGAGDQTFLFPLPLSKEGSGYNSFDGKFLGHNSQLMVLSGLDQEHKKPALQVYQNNTGSLLWRKLMRFPISKETTLITDQFLILGYGKKIVVLAAPDGTEKYRLQVKTDVRFPLLVAGDILLVPSPGGISTWDLASGSPLWALTCSQLFGGEVTDRFCIHSAVNDSEAVYLLGKKELIQLDLIEGSRSFSRPHAKIGTSVIDRLFSAGALGGVWIQSYDSKNLKMHLVHLGRSGQLKSRLELPWGSICAPSENPLVPCGAAGRLWLSELQTGTTVIKYSEPDLTADLMVINNKKLFVGVSDTGHLRGFKIPVLGLD